MKMPKLQFAIVATIFALGSFLEPAAQAGRWSTNSPLVTWRAQHTVTLLPGGEVLLAGGTTNRSAERYNPATGASAPTEQMTVTRRGHTAALLPGGKVLVVGGASDGPPPDNYWVASAELYDPSTGLWTATGTLNTRRSGHTMTLLNNGGVLVAGGIQAVGGANNSAEIYDPSFGMWFAVGSLSTSRYFHTATMLPNGKVLVAGGTRGSLPPPWAEISSAELYDPGSGTWSLTGSMHFARQRHTATLLPDGKVLVAGGDSSYLPIPSAELYDPADGTWTVVNPMTVARDRHTATLLPDGKVLITGGCGTNYTQLASTELYDPTNGTWTTSAAMHVPRDDHAATPLTNGQLLVTGGYSADVPTNSVERFDRLAGPVPTITTLMCATKSGAGSFGFVFTNTPGASFIVLATTNLALPASTWTPLTGVLEVSAGKFQFADPQAANSPLRFYRLVSP